MVKVGGNAQKNVPALRTKGSDGVLAALEAIGYTCWPLVVGAWSVGAPHQRNRVWIVAHRHGDGIRQQSKSSRRKDKTKPSGFSKTMADTDSKRLERGQTAKELWETFRFPAPLGAQQYDREAPRLLKPEVGRSANGAARRLALKALGNANPPQVVAMIGRAIMKVANKETAS